MANIEDNLVIDQNEEEDFDSDELEYDDAFDNYGGFEQWLADGGREKEFKRIDNSRLNGFHLKGYMNETDKNTIFLDQSMIEGDMKEVVVSSIHFVPQVVACEMLLQAGMLGEMPALIFESEDKAVQEVLAEHIKDEYKSYVGYACYAVNSAGQPVPVLQIVNNRDCVLTREEFEERTQKTENRVPCINFEHDFDFYRLEQFNSW